MKKRKNTIADFWRQVNQQGPDDCWNWMGRTSRYGQFSWNNRDWGAHRFAWAVTNNWPLDKLIPTDKFICHRCDNKLCCNPAHLYMGSHDTNTQDAHRSKLFACGEKNNLSKLTEQDVNKIRSMPYGRRGDNLRIQQKFGISRDQVRNIVNRMQWKHI